jgi:hypothetical protein
MPWMHSLATTIYIDKLSMTDQLNSGATEVKKRGNSSGIDALISICKIQYIPSIHKQAIMASQFADI